MGCSFFDALQRKQRVTHQKQTNIPWKKLKLFILLYKMYNKHIKNKCTIRKVNTKQWL